MGFIETVDVHALDDVDLTNVFALYNHDFNNVLGKTGKNLSLNVDEKGLSFSLELLPSDDHIFELVQDGIINKMSFGFIVQDDDWQDETHRTIKKLKSLQEISLVPVVPAYEGTDIVAKRELDMSEKTEETQEENSNIQQGEKRNMQTFNKAQDTESQEVRNFNAYLEGKIEKRDLTTVNGAPIIPQELLSEQYPNHKPQLVYCH
ncbi:hypothetical protein GCM10025878_12940 [Leuconostoc gasicomitatum]|mgnify:CR=1 FL=1|uniref:Phage head maturation protease n=3 Tax=Lactobacillaceae TaxID=33958 RepID=A0AAN2QTJ4_9LACO|nr:HK97 family phage prohead protease [Leuconostoc gasicomitatum]CBL92126.1 prophage pi1 protein 36, prohead protease [Leuconostoc gasicomitatum LMG 18811]CUR64154.1 Prohead protease [Leuconostoc gasicomitatum KG16-1]CUW03425.1 Phage head maturation protease [Leuconostoc inhae]MBZ5956040.1 HK97 family phage prohead protease [Leuconostoc gasicomitatum]